MSTSFGVILFLLGFSGDDGIFFGVGLERIVLLYLLVEGMELALLGLFAKGSELPVQVDNILVEDAGSPFCVIGVLDRVGSLSTR